MFVGLKYHIVRATDGFHMVPKSTAKIGSFYADVRNYSMEDWKQHKTLLLDITNSGSDQLKEEAAKSALGNTFDDAWDTWTGATEAP